MKLGLIFLYTGSGGGKTTNAFGLALRCIGHGLNAIVIQFMKGNKEIGEYKVKDRLAPELEVYQFGGEKWIDLQNPSQEDKRRAEEGLAFARKILTEKRPSLLVLDEINLATRIGLLKVEDILDLLDKVGEKTDVVLTGRHAPPELVDRADVVNVIFEVKAPEKLYTKLGITH